MKRILWLLLLIAISFPLVGIAENENEDKTLSPYFFVQGDPSVDQLPLKDTRVNIAVSGVIADVTILQIYSNEGSRPINARYVFPASTRAAVYAMKMRINDEIIYAKVKEREQAKQEFEKAKQEGKSASLLEQNRPNVFSMNLANILPGDRVEIELSYTELLVPTDRIYELDFPTVVGPRYSNESSETPGNSENSWIQSPYLHQGELPKSQFHLKVALSSGVPIQDVTSPSHQVHLNWKNPSLAEVELDESEGAQANRDFVLQYRLAGEQIATGLSVYRGKDENFFLYMAQPPVTVRNKDIPPREYIFVLDVSGSMYGFPLDTAKQLLRNLIANLKPTDKFNIVLFSGRSQVLSPTSLPADSEHVSEAIRLIDSQEGGGGTELLAALLTATGIPRESGFSRTTVLITDGYIAVEKGVFDFIRSRLNDSNVFSFGIGSSVNRYLIEGVAKAGLGEPFIVTSPNEAAATAEKFREYIQSPVLTDIQLHWNGLDVYDVEPQSLPDLFAQRPVVVFGKWRGNLSGSIELTGQTGSGAFQTQVDVSKVAPVDTNRALRYLWARTRIATLSDYGSDIADDDRIKEVTLLGLTYNLLTQYTSFIAVHERVRNTQGPGQDVNQPLPLPQGVSDLAVSGGVTGQDEPELYWLIAMLLVFAAFGALRTRRIPAAVPRG